MNCNPNHFNPLSANSKEDFNRSQNHLHGNREQRRRNSGIVAQNYRLIFALLIIACGKISHVRFAKF